MYMMNINQQQPLSLSLSLSLSQPNFSKSGIDGASGGMSKIILAARFWSLSILSNWYLDADPHIVRQ